MKRVGIVVGHSVTDPGAVNANGCSEFQFNAELSYMVAVELLKHGMNPVIIWRDRNYSAMPGKVNDHDVDFSIELHCNAFNTKASGSETLFFSGSSNSCKLATHIQGEVIKALGLNDRGAKGVSRDDRGGLMLVKTAKPHVILEPLFIDNAADLSVGEARKVELAVAIANGCKLFAEA
ncbi:N-acetylmuramoyl-L-alanine amidase [Vibrio phage 1.104.O._10N.286.49.A12]|nr:N-acetylmuramoyl-L-alanine amidase [Vibrio phage 1.104.O._10N.286.49.A12]